MSGSAQTDGDAQNANNEAAAADDDAQQQLSNSDGSAESNSHQDGGSAMTQTGQKQSAVVEQVRETVTEEVISALGEAQQEAREERDELVNLNAVLSLEEEGVDYDILDLTEGVPDDAVHVGGISPIVAGTNRQFCDETIFASVHYDAKDIMNNANEDNSIDFSANYIQGSLWFVIPTPTSGENGPSIEDALADLVSEVLMSDQRLAITIDAAEELLRTE